MPTYDLQPVFLSEEEAKLIASKQLLSFLFVRSKAKRPGQERELAPSKALFSFKALPRDVFRDAPPWFNWSSRQIYDVDGLLLFRDHTLKLDSDNEIQVRAAASDLLRTPVWSVRAGKAWDIDGLIAKALTVIKETTDLEPILVEGEKTVRLICYGYPRLGIPCRSQTQPSLKFVMDLWDLVLIPVGPTEQNAPPESVKTIWSPYDWVARPTIGHFRSRFQINLALLPELPETIEGLPRAIRTARAAIIEEQTTNPELTLIGQQTNFFCAPATAKLILEHHGISKTQDQIAAAMHTLPTGTRPEDQVRAIPGLTRWSFDGRLDNTTSFSEAKDEIRANRPFKTGTATHARACGGFKVEQGGKEWLYLYDPLPSNQGCIYFENWEADHYLDYMYVRPSLYL